MSCMTTRFPRWLAGCVVVAAVVTQPGAARGQPTDADFVAARDAFRAGDAARLERIAPGLKGYLLEPYVEYWQLKLGIDEADPAAVRAFLARNADMPLAEQLRTEWLKSLGKRGEWALFGTEYEKRPGEDTELACYATQWRRQRDGDRALDEAHAFWFSGREQPESCQPVLAALVSTGKLTPNDIWARFRLAHEAGNYRLAAKIAAALPPAEQPPPREFERINLSARSVLAKGSFRFSASFGRELSLYALDRVAATDASAAHDAWVRWRDRLPESDRSYGDVLVAYQAARQLLPQANDWYARVDAKLLNESQRAWRVRAALRAGAWDDVAQAIDAMPEADAQDPSWRYWKARALAATGHDEDATRLYGTLAPEPHFYGLLAAEALGASVRPVSEPLSPSPDALAAFGARPAVQRVVKLSALDLRPEGQREWVAVVRGLDDDKLLLAATFAHRNGLYDRSINTADRTKRRHDYGLRYPTPYQSEIEDATRKYDLDPALVYGLVRQESRFVPDVVSGAGAVGLMQLMPPTARWVAKQTGRPSRALNLQDPALNAQLGAYYLRYVMERLGRVPVLAAAAYNAGPGRAQSWRGSGPLEGAIYVETIPFNETRDYTKKVLANAMFYQARLGLPYVALRDRLGTIPPRGAPIESGTPLDAPPAAPADRPESSSP